MSMEMTDLTQRLVRAEVEIALLRTSAGRSRRSRTIAEVSVLAALAIIMASRSTSTQAQGVGQTITGPFVVKGPGGNKIFEVKESSGRDQSQMLLYNGQEKVAAAVMTMYGEGWVGISDASGEKFIAVLTADTEGNGLLAIGDKAGNHIADIKKGPNAQGLAVYRPGTTKIAVSLLSSATQAVVSVRNSQDVPSGMGVENDASLTLNDRANTPIADIEAAAEPAPGETPTTRETARSRGLHVYSAKGDLAVRAVADYKGSGRFVVVGEDGSAGLLAVNSGGSGAEMMLAGPKGHVKVNLSSEDGFSLNAKTDGGPPVVEINVNDSGGRFVLADNAGQIMIQGGITDAGRGVLRAGPRIGGPIASSGLPNAILGLAKQ